MIVTAGSRVAFVRLLPPAHNLICRATSVRLVTLLSNFDILH